MSTETEFVAGRMVKAPHEKAPEFVKAAISIKREELIGWLAGRSEEWINIDVKVAKSGKWYAAVNSFKKDDAKPVKSPTGKPEKERAGYLDDDGDIPFN